jgi:hypothetical protein
MFGIIIEEVEFVDKLIIGLLFIISCIIGISLTIKPNWIGICIEQRIHGTDNPLPKKVTKLKSKVRTIKHQGHHPNCDQFRSHTLEINNKVLCAGCTGLAIGAGISIFLVSCYLVFPYKIPKIFDILGFSLGMIFITVNFAQVIFPHKNPQLHLVSNTLLVTGFLLIVISLLQSSGKVIFGIFGIMVSMLWLDTRIMLSKWNHELICNYCTAKCN